MAANVAQMVCALEQQQSQYTTAAPMTVEEAAFDLDILDHDFYLLEKSKCGQVGLLSVLDNGRYQLAIAHDAGIEIDFEHAR